MPSTDAAMLVANRYERLSPLGEGAMGVVYQVRDRLTQSEVALKQVQLDALLLAPESDQSAEDDPRVALANEFQLLSSLRHPHIVSVLDYGFDAERQPYFTMTLLHDPRTLLAAGEDLPLVDQVRLLVQLLQALAYVHRRGIIHRDLKPNNVLVKDQHVYVLDFGLAIQRGTESEQTAGTLSYMAPEVLTGSRPGEAADLYAVGVIAYEMFSGRSPYTSEDISKLIMEILHTPIDVEVIDLPSELRAVLARLLAKNPDDRYTDASAVLAALCAAVDIPVPPESAEIRESFLQAADFVGREAELDTLKAALSGLVNEQAGSAFLVGGESGIGKSRLIDEISTRALVDGVLVLRGQMTSEGGLAYQLWRDVLRRLVLMVELDAGEAALLKTVLPDLPDLLGAPVADLEDSADLQKRLLLVIEAVFRRALEQRPVLLVLEDLHWATESLTLLEHLSPLVDELPLLIVGSYRNDERPDMPERLPGMVVMTLERLQDREIERLSQSMLGQVGGHEDVVDLIQRETEGNVFFIVEVVRALAEEAGSLANIGRATLPSSVFAGGVRRIVQRRLSRVPDWAQHALRLAAVSGRQLDLDLLRAALPGIDVDHWLTVCSNAAVFDVQDGQWRFAHDKLREAVRDDLPAEEKPALHRAVAEAIETVYADYLDDYAAVLVYHWAEAGDEAKEGAYVTRAGAAMYRRNEYREMKRLYERALELKTYEHTDHPRKAYADLISELGRAAYTLSEYEAVERWRSEALAIYEELGDTYGIAESLAALGEVRLRQGRGDEALPIVGQARELYESIGERKKMAYADMSAGIIYSQKGQFEQAYEYMHRSHLTMQAVGEPLDQARGLNNLGVVTDLLGDLEQARVYHQQALTIRRRINDRHGIAYSLNNLGVIADMQGDYEEAERLQVESLRLLRLLGEKMAQAIALNGMGDLYMRMERYGDAERCYAECVQLREGFGHRSGVADALKGLGNVARERHEIDRAWTYYLDALEHAEAAESEGSLHGVFYSVGRLLITLEHHLPAARLIAAAAQSTNSHHQKELDEVLASLAAILPPDDYETAIEQGQHSTTAELAALVRSLAPVDRSSQPASTTNANP